MNAELHEHLRRFRRPGTDRDNNLPPPDPERSSVKRALFGRVDHEENVRFVKEQLERSRREAKEKWNFDFGNEIPMDGRYKWEPVTPPIPQKKVLQNANKTETKPTTPKKANSDLNSRSDSETPDKIKPRSDSKDLDNYSSDSAVPIVSENNRRQALQRRLEHQSDSSSAASSSMASAQAAADRVCDNSSSSSSSSATNSSSSSSTSQRKSRHQKKMTDFADFTQRKSRSKSKVKAMERKSDTESRDLLSLDDNKSTAKI